MVWGKLMGGEIDQLRARKDRLLADRDLHGKLLYAWVMEKRLRRRNCHEAHRLDQPHQAPPVAGLETPASGTGHRHQRRS